MRTKNESCLLLDVEMAGSEMGCNHFGRSALDAKVDIRSTFWRGNKIKTTKTWELKFLGLNCYHIKLMWTKNEGCLLSDVEMAVSEMGCNHFRRSALDAKVDIWSTF